MDLSFEVEGPDMMKLFEFFLSVSRSQVLLTKTTSGEGSFLISLVGIQVYDELDEGLRGLWGVDINKFLHTYLRLVSR